MTKGQEQLTVFSIGAIAYSLIEFLWRQHTHWTMSLTGGTCFIILYNLYNRYQKMPLFKKCAIGSAVITALEFVVGMLVNVWQKWNVWDYSGIQFNLFGQICMLYSFLWFLLSMPIDFLSQTLYRKLRKAS